MKIRIYFLTVFFVLLENRIYGKLDEEMEKKIERISSEEVRKIAPDEVELLKALISDYYSCYQTKKCNPKQYRNLIELQIEFLEELVKTSHLQAEAEKLERESYEMMRQMETEQYAYEFFLDQIMASGLVSYWTMP